MLMRVGSPDPEPVKPEPMEAKSEDEQHRPAKTDAASRKKPRLTIEALRDELAQRGVSVRLNVITVETDIDGCTESGMAYEKDTLLARLHSALSADYAGCSFDTLSAYIDFIARENSYNPVADYISGITWDKRSRFSELVSIMGIETDQLSQALLYKWLLQAVALLHNNDINNPFGASGVLVLKGEQGTGKTSLLRHLAMKPIWFGEGLSIKDNDKDTSRRVCTKFISELGEVETTLKSDIEGLKNFVTQPVDFYRLPYGRSDIKNCRHTSLAATCNSDRYLIDTTGNRRWWTIPIQKRMPYAEIQKIDAVQLWAEIWRVVEECGDLQGCFRLTDEEERLLAIRNGEAEKYLKSEAEILDILAEAENNPSVYEEREITVSEFKRMYDSYLRPYSVEVIGKALARHGYKAERKRICGKLDRYIKLPVKSFASGVQQSINGVLAFNRGHTQNKTRQDTLLESLEDFD